MPSMIEVATDINRALQRAVGARALETRSELANNVYPLLMSIMEAVDERFQEMESVVAEIAENGGSLPISPEVAQALQTAFAAADTMANYAGQHLPEEFKAEFARLVKDYNEAVQAAADAIKDNQDGDDEDEEEVDDEDIEEEEDDEEGV
jgi:cobalamin biosynthesis protein CobT